MAINHSIIWYPSTKPSTSSASLQRLSTPDTHFMISIIIIITIDTIFIYIIHKYHHSLFIFCYVDSKLAICVGQCPPVQKVHFVSTQLRGLCYSCVYTIERSSIAAVISAVVPMEEATVWLTLSNLWLLCTVGLCGMIYCVPVAMESASGRGTLERNWRLHNGLHMNCSVHSSSWSTNALRYLWEWGLQIDDQLNQSNIYPKLTIHDLTHPDIDLLWMTGTNIHSKSTKVNASGLKF